MTSVLTCSSRCATNGCYFEEPTQGTGDDAPGWWFRDSDEGHTDLWASHGLPHLLVLHDPETHVSYWAHVTPEIVVPPWISYSGLASWA